MTSNYLPLKCSKKCIYSFLLLTLLFLGQLNLESNPVKIGLDCLFERDFSEGLKGKKVGLITNRASINGYGESALQLFYENQKKHHFELKALFAPEHGLEADLEAFAFVKSSEHQSIPVYSLHGSTKKPTPEMLKDLDVLIYDLQSVGTRCYTYETTLFYAMEEAASQDLEVWVLDRPNPLGGEVIEGPLLQKCYKCFFGQLEIPFRHGMTIGELAILFRERKHLTSPLKVIPMEGWNRQMFFAQTGLEWKATSPNIPDAETTLVYPATIVLGETLEIVNIDKGGEYPFKRLGAPWISSTEFAGILNAKGCPGVHFEPHEFLTTHGRYKGKVCGGVFLKINNPSVFRAMEVQKLLIQTLTSLYPSEFEGALQEAIHKGRNKTCNYLTGSEALFSALQDPDHYEEKVKEEDSEAFEEFLNQRLKILLY